MTVNVDSLTSDEKQAIKILGGSEGKSGVRTIALEDDLSRQQIEEPRNVLGDLYRKHIVSLHESDGTEWNDKVNLFIPDAELRCNTYIYTSLRYKLTDKGLELYKKLQSEERVELTDTESYILQALGTETLRGQKLLEKAGYDNSSHYRTILSHLVKRSVLGRNERGYYAKNQF